MKIPDDNTAIVYNNQVFLNATSIRGFGAQVFVGGIQGSKFLTQRHNDNDFGWDALFAIGINDQ